MRQFVVCTDWPRCLWNSVLFSDTLVLFICSYELWVLFHSTILPSRGSILHEPFVHEWTSRYSVVSREKVPLHTILLTSSFHYYLHRTRLKAYEPTRLPVPSWTPSQWLSTFNLMSSLPVLHWSDSGVWLLHECAWLRQWVPKDGTQAVYSACMHIGLNSDKIVISWQCTIETWKITV
jgi:hypothetical protein